MIPEVRMVRATLLLLVMLNPFATMLYLTNLMQERSRREFSQIYIRAVIFTGLILWGFALTGEFILDSVFQVSLPAVRIFGGITIFMAAYTYIMQGPEGIKLFKGDVTTVAQNIALPFLVGPGAIWVSISMGQDFGPLPAGVMILIALAVNTVATFLYAALVQSSPGKLTLTRIVSYFQMAMRLNALLIGAVAVQMILSGIQEFISIGA
jgi:small neutral amino acid transporter SnatA (MarC family)